MKRLAGSKSGGNGSIEWIADHAKLEVGVPDVRSDFLANLSRGHMMTPFKTVAVPFSAKPDDACLGDGLFATVAWGELTLGHAVRLKECLD